MIIEEEFGNDYYGDLVIENYPNLEKIVVKKNSLRNLNSLKICNNEKLKTIEIEDGVFKNVKNVIIESTWLFDYLIFSNLPNLQSFETGDNSFYKITSLSLSSMIIKFDYLTFSNLPNLQSFKTGNGSFWDATSLSLSGMIIKFSIN